MSSFSKRGSSAMTGGATGAAIGSTFGPVGSLIGAGAGSLLGLFRGRRRSQPVYTPPQYVMPERQYGNFYTPLGDLTSNASGVTFNPKLTALQQAAADATDRHINTILGSLPTQFNVNEAFNNPFYHSTLDALQRPLQQRRQQEITDLTNELSARNQLGSSYDALQRNLFNQRYDNLMRDAENRARELSFEAYQQQFDNQLQALANLRNDRSAALDASYLPARIGPEYLRYYY